MFKIGVDPDPKCENNSNELIIKKTSDNFFETLDETNIFDVVFIDGMHHCENLLRDFNNSLKFLSPNGIILIDDIFPLNYNEQLKVPGKHYYENGILKYGEEWTGDVWKFIYFLIRNYNDKITFSYFYNINFRGIIKIQILEKFNVIENYDEINAIDYFEDFKNYVYMLTNKNKSI